MTETYRFIAGEAATYSLVILCRALGVSRSGYYAWKERPVRQDQLAPQVEEVFWQNSRRYGSRRITAELREQTVIGRHQLLKQHGFEQSMTRADETYDNAYAEILFSRYKTELLEDGAFADLEQARSETFVYIEGYYNRTRRHSGLGYLSPENFERAFDQRTQRPG